MEGVQDSEAKSGTILLLEARTLTDDGADNESDIIRLSPLNQIELAVNYTAGAGEAAALGKVQLFFSNDGVEFYPYAIASDSAPSGGIVTSTLYIREFSLVGVAGDAVNMWFAVPTAAKYFKVQAFEDGVITNFGVLSVEARLSDVSSLIF